MRYELAGPDTLGILGTFSTLVKADNSARRRLLVDWQVLDLTTGEVYERHEGLRQGPD